MELKVEELQATRLALGPGEVLLLTPADGRILSVEAVERVQDAFVSAFAAAGARVDRRRILVAGSPCEVAVVAA